MLTLITGGSKCGKSQYAEELLKGIVQHKFYLATMKPFGKEAEAAIRRHRIMRQDKHFTTIEQYTDVNHLNLPNDSSVLLECMGNLTANEMFRDNLCLDCTDKVISDILALNRSIRHLVIVTNQVGSDGIRYDTGTTAYLSALGKINQKLASFADSFIECVWGIPVIHKGGTTC